MSRMNIIPQKVNANKRHMAVLTQSKSQNPGVGSLSAKKAMPAPGNNDVGTRWWSGSTVTLNRLHAATTQATPICTAQSTPRRSGLPMAKSPLVQFNWVSILKAEHVRAMDARAQHIHCHKNDPHKEGTGRGDIREPECIEHGFYCGARNALERRECRAAATAGRRGQMHRTRGRSAVTPRRRTSGRPNHVNATVAAMYSMPPCSRRRVNVGDTWRDAAMAAPFWWVLHRDADFVDRVLDAPDRGDSTCTLFMNMLGSFGRVPVRCRPSSAPFPNSMHR
ncbi:Aste57867_23066 [Aphanomyces stellatus]|uniref:Aste57867_23066 protein n=1 Tax=Aphanomyces stellatus TaxID=120398 RepID=A0A485LND6_9STRA|nr:hypothetical protein As57867_022995 [Aphanomyces stellatus]VFT99714.1 Aste57867_23066 [Aphanomyces stellatus]